MKSSSWADGMQYHQHRNLHNSAEMKNKCNYAQSKKQWA